MENEEKIVNEEVENTVEVKDNSEELNKLKEEYNELDDRYKRMFAEFENYKKRSQKEKEGIYGMITGDVVATMLPVMDNLQAVQKMIQYKLADITNSLKVLGR